MTLLTKRIKNATGTVFTVNGDDILNSSLIKHRRKFGLINADGWRNLKCLLGFRATEHKSVLPFNYRGGGNGSGIWHGFARVVSITLSLTLKN